MQKNMVALENLTPLKNLARLTPLRYQPPDSKNPSQLLKSNSQSITGMKVWVKVNLKRSQAKHLLIHSNFTISLGLFDLSLT